MLLACAALITLLWWSCRLVGTGPDWAAGLSSDTELGPSALPGLHADQPLVRPIAWLREYLLGTEQPDLDTAAGALHEASNLSLHVVHVMQPTSFSGK